LWTLTIALSAVSAVILKVSGYPNVAIPLAALCGAALFYALKNQRDMGGE
jgi:hypothetical protein